MSTLVDSNVFVDHLRGYPAATALLSELRTTGPVRASILTRAELRSGSRGTDPETSGLLEQIVWEPISDAVADRAGEFARRFAARFPGLGLVDYLIAATADVRGLGLLTRNVRHFPMFPDLQPPY